MRAQHVCWAVSLVAAALSITTAPAGAQVKWAATVHPDRVVPTEVLTLTPNTKLAEDATAELTLTCQGGAQCDRVKVEIVQNVQNAPSARREIPAKSKSAGSAVYVITSKTDILGSGGSTVMEVSLNGAVLEHFTLEREGATTGIPVEGGGDRNGKDDDGGTPLAELLAVDCRPQFRLGTEPNYDESRDMARFVVTPLGNVLRRPAAIIDEDDSVRVVVLADKRLLPLLKVHRTSEIRTIGTVQIIGQGTDLPSFREQAGGAVCGMDSTYVRDFAHGKGEVEIRALTGKSNESELTQAIGTFDFNVNPLYSGAFSLGAMRTELSEPDFGLNVDGADSTITVRSNGPYRVKYVLMYTHFIWGKRDVEKLPPNLLQRINPSIGVVLDDITENFVGGLTADLFEGVYLSGGAHFGRVKELDPESGLEVGDAFSGDEDDIPTLERWRVKPFFSVGVDVRAAAELLRMALTGSKAGG